MHASGKFNKRQFLRLWLSLLAVVSATAAAAVPFIVGVVVPQATAQRTYLIRGTLTQTEVD